MWVSSLRDTAVQRGVLDLLQREQVDAVLCTTSFASVQSAEAGLGAPLWEELGAPVFQVLCSTQSAAAWQASPVGLASLDLTLQIAMPELDGRITTRVGAFKELEQADERLATGLHRYVPAKERLAWVSELIWRWCDLRATPPEERRLALVLANYPTRNARLANGVGLDTPASVRSMLAWLQDAGYSLGAEIPGDGDALIAGLLAGRTNDPESSHLKAADHLQLQTYLEWYAALPSAARQSLEAQWGNRNRTRPSSGMDFQSMDCVSETWS